MKLQMTIAMSQPPCKSAWTQASCTFAEDSARLPVRAVWHSPEVLRSTARPTGDCSNRIYSMTFTFNQPPATMAQHWVRLYSGLHKRGKLRTAGFQCLS